MMNSTSFVNSVFKITSGSFFGQFILAISSPIITRIYEPKIFGFFATYNAIVKLVSAIAPLRYEMALVIAKKNNDSRHLALLSFVFVSIIVIAIFLISMFIRKFVSDNDIINVLVSYPFYVCFGIFFWAVLNILISIETRHSNFSNIASLKFIKPSFTAISQIFYGIMINSSVYGLFIGDLIGSFVCVIFLTTRSFNSQSIEKIKSLSLSNTIKMMIRYKSFPIYGTWSVLVSSLMLQLPTLIIANYYPLSIVGLFALANRMLQMPMALFNSGLSQVFLKSASVDNSQKNIKNLVLKIFSRLMMFGLLPILVVSLIGEELFSIIFGRQWSEAGRYTQILSFWCFSAFLVQPLAHLVNIFEKQKEGLIINIIRLLVRIGTLSYCVIFQINIINTLIYFSMAGVLSNFIFLFYLLRLSKNSLKDIIFVSGRYIFVSVIFCLPLLIVKQLYIFPDFILILLSISLLIFYGLFSFMIDSGFRKLVYNAIFVEKR